MSVSEKDPKRTGVKAVRIDWTEPPCELVDHRWHAPPGSMFHLEGGKGGIAGFLIACPGCGQIGSARAGASWQVVAGSVDDVSTLSLSPSIAKGCCGWHGYLAGGVFVSC